MSNKSAPTMEITEKALKELFERCNGRRSHYLIMTDEPIEYCNLLEKEGWIIQLKNGGKRPWYTASQKLIEKFRPLEKHEVAQIKAAAFQAEEDAIEEEKAMALKAKQQSISAVAAIYKAEKEEKDIKVGTVCGPDGHLYESVAAAARAMEVHPTTMRKWCNDPENKSWIKHD